MITSSFSSGAGKIDINIDSTHGSVAQIANLGSLNYSFDQTPDTLSIDRVQALYTFINVDLLQYDDGGHDLWTILTGETNTAQLPVEMVVELPGGAFQFFFRLRKSDISLNEKQGIVTIRLTPLTNFNTRMGQFFDSLYSGGVPNRNFTAKSINESGGIVNFNYRSVASKNFIEKALNEIFQNNFESVSISSATDLGNGFSESVFDQFTNSKRQFVLCDVRTEGGLSGTSKVSPSTPEDSIEVGIGEIGSLGLPSLTVNITIPAENNAGLGDVIYYGDDAPFFNGRKIGTIVDFSTGIFPTFTIQKDEDDNVPLPFGSFPFKIQRAKRPENTLLIDVLKDLAGIEGSVFGTGFSRNWFINRLAVEEQGSENLVTLNYNELQEFKPFNLTLSIGKSVVGQLAEYRSIGTDLFGQWNQKLPILTDENENPQTGSGVPNLSSFNSITSGNKEATKGIDISLAPAYPFLNKGLTTSSTVIGTQDSTINDASLESALTRNGLKSYFQALNSTKDSIAVEFTILDAVKVLPFQLFQFDSRAPERYRDKQFRITQVSYNFVNNTSKIKGYQISGVTTPVVDDPRPVVPPPRVVPPFAGDPIGKLVVGVDDETVSVLKINLFQRVKTGQSILLINNAEYIRDFFIDENAGEYEVVVDDIGDEPVEILTGIKDVPIQSQRINAPAGSFIYTSDPYEKEDDNDTDDEIDELNEKDREFDDRIDDLNNELDLLDIELGQLDEALTELNDVTLPQLQQDLEENEAAINTLNTVTLPALQEDLDDAESAINTLNNTTIPNLQAELDAVLPITEVKISNDAISAPKIQTNAITAGKILAGAVIAEKIATDAVTANKIQANAVVAAKISAGAVIADKIATDAVTANKIQAGAIVAAKISAGAVIADKIATDAVTANKIQAGAVITNKLSAKAVVASKIDVDDLAANSAFIDALMAQTLTIRTGGKIESSNFSAGSSGFQIKDNGDTELNNLILRGTLLSLGNTINPPKIFAVTANGEFVTSPDGTKYTVSWSRGDTVLNSDRIEIIYYRNGVIVGTKTGIETTASPDENTISGGSSGQEVFVVVNLTRGGDIFDSIQTRQVPQLI